MTNMLLAPEEDDSDLARGQSVEIALRRGVSDAERQSEVQRFCLSFDPQSGLGIRPWPGVEAAPGSRDNIAIAMKYLRDGAEQKIEEESE